MNWVSAKQARQILHISTTTLFHWKNEGIIKFKPLTKRKFLYDIDSVDMKDNSYSKQNVIYARVSNTKQKQDLDKQIEIIKSYMLANGIKPDKVYSDIASGMNENRNDFNSLILDVISNRIDTIYITYKDRLTRFGFSYFENIFSKFGTKIEVLDKTEENDSAFQTELANDLISIIHHFSMKLYSNRRKKLKEIENIIKSE